MPAPKYMLTAAQRNHAAAVAQSELNQIAEEVIKADVPLLFEGEAESELHKYFTGAMAVRVSEAVLNSLNDGVVK